MPASDSDSEGLVIQYFEECCVVDDGAEEEPTDISIVAVFESGF